MLPDVFFPSEHPGKQKDPAKQSEFLPLVTLSS
jgi:hypothetical protein